MLLESQILHTAHLSLWNYAQVAQKYSYFKKSQFLSFPRNPVHRPAHIPLQQPHAVAQTGSHRCTQMMALCTPTPAAYLSGHLPERHLSKITDNPVSDRWKGRSPTVIKILSDSLLLEFKGTQ